jgi:hypothetical protein
MESTSTAEMAIPAGLEPATRGVEIRYSIQLSYGTVRVTYRTISIARSISKIRFSGISAEPFSGDRRQSRAGRAAVCSQADSCGRRSRRCPKSAGRAMSHETLCYRLSAAIGPSPFRTSLIPARHLSAAQGVSS